MRPLRLILPLIVFCTCTSRTTVDQADTSREISLSTLALSELTGEGVDVSSFKGKVVFVNFWATWCAPCIREMPSIERASLRLDPAKIEFLLASNETTEQIEHFLKSRSVKMHFVRVENFDDLGIQAIPTTMIFDREGSLIFSEAGFRIWDDASSFGLVSGLLED